MTCKLNKYPYFKDGCNDYDDTLAEKIISTFKEKYKREWTFDEVFHIISNQELLECLKWLERQCIFCFDVLSQNMENSISRKKKVLSIIDEL